MNSDEVLDDVLFSINVAETLWGKEKEKEYELILGRLKKTRFEDKMSETILTFYKGIVNFNLNNFEQAEVLFSLVAKSEFVPIDANYYLGLIKVKRHDFSGAHNLFNKEIELNPKNSKAYNGRGYVFFQMGEFNNALKNFKRTVEIDKKNIIGCVNSSLIDCMNGEYESAQKNLDVSLNILKTALKTESVEDHMSLFYFMARVNLALNANEKVQKYFQEIVDQPIHSDCDLYLHLEALVNIGAYKEAIKEADVILNEVKEKARINVILGDLYRFEDSKNKEKRYWEDAELYYKHALKIYMGKRTKTIEDYLLAERAASGLRKMNIFQNSDVLRKGVMNVENLNSTMMDNFLRIYR